MHNDNNNSKDN